VLSDHERETLREIQRQLIVDDPTLEQTFRALEKPIPAPATRCQRIYTLIIVVATLLAVVLLLIGSAGGALAFATIAGSVWLARHFQRAAGDRPPGD
jgi:hypothetical protein